MTARNAVTAFLTTAILAVSLLGCREAPGPTATPTIVATMIATSAPPTATPAPPTSTPEPLQIIGRWRHEHAEEGLTYSAIIEFFADGQFSAIVEGQVSPCLILLETELCELFPGYLPFALSLSGPYLFLAEDRIRIEIEEAIDPTLARFLKQFDQRLEAFNVALPDDNTLILEQDGVNYVYSRVR